MVFSASFRAALCTALLFPALCHGWGFNGHRRLASKIHEPLPNSCIKSWLSVQAANAAFQDDACDPDRWRVSSDPNYDPAEAPRHYLDIDWAAPIESYPRTWPEVQARFGQYAERNGKVPFRVEEMYARLVARFQANDSAGAAREVAWMSHYVTDAFSPFHDTKSSDPRIDQNDTVGGHARYESDLLGSSTYLNNIATAANSHYGTVGRADPKHHIFDIIIVGNPLAATIESSYRTGSGDLPTLYNATNNLTSRRWGDALTLLSGLVVSAWVDAGKPVLTGMPSGCSMIAPQGTLSLKGYPLPPKTWGDAGVLDAGDGGGAGGGAAGGGAGGVGGGFAGGVGVGGGAGGGTPGGEPPCGCGGPTAAIFFLPLLGLVALRRRSS